MAPDGGNVATPVNVSAVRPEWMLEVPSDLGPEAWSVMAKPEGEWTLVVAAHGKTVSRRKNGRTLHEFASVLPHGSPQTGTGSSDFSMLQCVFHEADQTYYVVDVVFWKGLDVGASDFSFRQFWLHSKLAEIPEICTSGVGNKYRFQPIPVFDCSMDGLGQAYSAQMQFVKDGLLFFFKTGHYEEGLSPCLLAWKDAKTSRFPIDSPDGIHPYPVQTCVLRISLVSGTLMLRALGDDLVGILNVEDAKAHALENGSVARFAVPSGGLEVVQDEEGAAQTGTAAVPPQASARTGAGLDTLAVPAAPTIPEAAASVAHVWICGLRFHSACRPNARPDSSCRVAFQYAMRHDPLTIEKLTAGLACAGNDMELR
ncbi:Snurportin-1 [Hondaea fermentalgiana]|uniref:Snurportin-1 n=1 Tax=Hondaea fermentalgiana TaxID=2315210 RepID=A0A2R5G8Z9_9STRA|nr:Snurportin-1 [Hondaea fermentalgiana]|eukprot:GBG26809.1 Snurportin-1 [Hondaea fermentalgiana]